MRIIMQFSETAGFKNGVAKPVLLKILCSLSFVSSGLSALFFLICMLFSGSVLQFFNEYALGESSAPFSIYIISVFIFFILFTMSLLGVFFMFGQKKKGFGLYLIPNSILMVLNIVIIYITFSPLWIAYLIASIAFIILYASLVKQMK